MMYKEKKTLFLKVLTPLHAGSGTDLRAVDLPIQRETHTGFPKIEASTLKGCLRDSFEKNKVDENLIKTMFGKEGESDLSAAALAITDARLLFFPVRSAKGVYALITCPMVLKRFQNDMRMMDIEIRLPNMDKLPVFGSRESVLRIKIDGEKCAILLDEYRYDVSQNVGDDHFIKLSKELETYFDQPTSIETRAVILPDDDFKDFVTHATPVVTRIKVGENGVVENQALFTEEYLPEESILYSLAMMGNSKVSSDSANAGELMSAFSNAMPKIFQIGANETLGKGFVGACLKGGEGNE